MEHPFLRGNKMHQFLFNWNVRHLNIETEEKHNWNSSMIIIEHTLPTADFAIRLSV